MIESMPSQVNPLDDEFIPKAEAEPEGEPCQKCGKVHPPMPTNTAELVDYEIRRFVESIEEGGEDGDEELKGLPISAHLTAQMRQSDPDALNYVAMIAGLYHTRAKRLSAEHEAGRKAKELEIRNAIMEERGVSATAAKELVRDDERYTAYQVIGRELDFERDTAEVLWESLKQQTRIVGRGPSLLGAARVSLADLFGKREEPAPAEN